MFGKRDDLTTIIEASSNDHVPLPAHSALCSRHHRHIIRPRDKATGLNNNQTFLSEIVCFTADVVGDVRETGGAKRTRRQRSVVITMNYPVTIIASLPLAYSRFQDLPLVNI